MTVATQEAKAVTRLDRALDIRRRAVHQLLDPNPAPDPEADELLKDYEDWGVRMVLWCIRIAALAVVAGVTGLIWWWAS